MTPCPDRVKLEAREGARLDSRLSMRSPPGPYMRADTPLGRQLAANTLHAVSGRLVMLLVWLVLVPRILAALGAERFAIWSLFFALTGYLGALDFGLAQGTLRHVSAARATVHPDGGGGFASLAALGYLALGSAWLILTLVASDRLLALSGVPPEHHDIARFVMQAGTAVFVLAGLANTMQSVLQGYGRFDVANTITLAMAAQQIAGILFVLRMGWGLEGLVINSGLGWLLGSGLGLAHIRRVAPSFRWGSPARGVAQLGEAMRFGAPIQVASIFTVAHAQIDKFFLARFVALAAVTPYELGFRVVTAAVAVPQLLVLAVMPAAAALHARNDGARLADLYRRGNRYVLAASAVVLAGTLASAGRLYAAWLGPGHDDATLALRGLAFTAVMTLATGIGVAVARGVGRTDLEGWFAIIVFGTHAALSLWLIPARGLAGALIAMFVATTLGTVVFLWKLAGALGWSRARTLLDPFGVPLLAAVVGTLASWGMDRTLPAASGSRAWPGFVAVAASGALGATAICLGTRYVRWSEARSLVGRAGGASR